MLDQFSRTRLLIGHEGMDKLSKARIVASDNDIFFPADRVFMRAKEIFKGPVTTVRIDSKHLPSEETMTRICGQTAAFLKENA